MVLASVQEKVMTENTAMKPQTGSKMIHVGNGLMFKSSDESGKPPHLIGAKCGICGYISFPKTRACPNCQSDESWQEVSLAPRGRLVTYAVSQQAPVGFTAPYIQANIQLDDGPVVFSLVTGCEPRDGALEVGQEMELVIDKIYTNESGDEVIGWKFRPSSSRK